ncbi:ABC transporter ATP-binding protein [Sphaerisporangium dianthi]|uniref:ATP-binding cassette domain-containing protein n=1 Tax=Sphaerisporangium dianthi TaxID=1436120 RepID=A0ABV9CSJ0_9ACTN
MITFEGVTKRYGDGTVAVDNLSLQVPTGAITVFVGPSGCGKTTSLRMINRMIDATSGRILLDDQDVRHIDPPTLRRGIGYVIQQAGLFPHRKIVDNVATVPYLLGWDKKKARARAMELLERVGLDTKLAGRYPFQLSGGQQQRVGVARALAADPPVLLMDEPFSAVDPVVRTSLQDELLRLQSDLHKTIVFVTHDIDEAIKLGDTVAVLRVGGHLAQIAAPSTLLAEPADEFVEGFLGRDRGIRRLSFVPAEGVATRRERDVPGWTVVLDADDRPLGWRANGSSPASGTSGSAPASGTSGSAPASGTSGSSPASGTTDSEPASGTSDSGPVSGAGDSTRAASVRDGLLPFGTFDRRTDSLRTALDAALLAPSGCAIAVDGEGRFEGIVTREALDEALARARAVSHG